MICVSKTKYECIYLDKSNVDEFIEWIGKYYEECSIRSSQSEHYLYLNIIDKDDYSENYEFTFGRWYVYKNGVFYDYSDKVFKEKYDVVG